MFQLLLVIIYLAFISLGLPDALLGSAWPSTYRELGASVSYAGIISMIIAGGTIISSLFSDRLIRAFGTGKVTVISVAMTAAALFGFSSSHSFIQLCLWAIPYGLGAGSVDAGLNNFVALHYKSRHMSWLHCFWGIGATAGPYIMGLCLTRGFKWNSGYMVVGVIQIALVACLVLSLPLWKVRTEGSSGQDDTHKQITMGCGFRGQRRCLLHFSATVLLRPQPVCGPAVIWCCIRELPPRQRQNGLRFFTWVLPWAGWPAVLSRTGRGTGTWCAAVS